MNGDSEHWRSVYRRKPEQELSWFESNPRASFDVVRRYCPGTDARILDVGAGSSRTVDVLLDFGYSNLTALDIADVYRRGHPEDGRARTNRFVARPSALSLPNRGQRPGSIRRVGCALRRTRRSFGAFHVCDRRSRNVQRPKRLSLRRRFSRGRVRPGILRRGSRAHRARNALGPSSALYARRAPTPLAA